MLIYQLFVLKIKISHSISYSVSMLGKNPSSQGRPPEKLLKSMVLHKANSISLTKRTSSKLHKSRTKNETNISSKLTNFSGW